jgi:hypothetical protein
LTVKLLHRQEVSELGQFGVTGDQDGFRCSGSRRSEGIGTGYRVAHLQPGGSSLIKARPTTHSPSPIAHSLPPIAYRLLFCPSPFFQFLDSTIQHFLTVPWPGD